MPHVYVRVHGWMDEWMHGSQDGCIGLSVWLAWACRSSSHLVVLQFTVYFEDIRGVSPAHELRDNQEDDQQEKEEHHAHNQLIRRQPSSNVSYLHAETDSDSDSRHHYNRHSVTRKQRANREQLQVLDKPLSLSLSLSLSFWHAHARIFAMRAMLMPLHACHPTLVLKKINKRWKIKLPVIHASLTLLHSWKHTTRLS